MEEGRALHACLFLLPLTLTLSHKGRGNNSSCRINKSKRLNTFILSFLILLFALPSLSFAKIEGLSYLADTKKNQLVAFDNLTGQPYTTGPAELDPTELVRSPAGDFVYMLNAGSRSLGAFERKKKKTTFFKIGQHPVHMLRIQGDGERLYVVETDKARGKWYLLVMKKPVTGKLRTPIKILYAISLSYEPLNVCPVFDGSKIFIIGKDRIEAIAPASPPKLLGRYDITENSPVMGFSAGTLTMHDDFVFTLSDVGDLIVKFNAETLDPYEEMYPSLLPETAIPLTIATHPNLPAVYILFEGGIEGKGGGAAEVPLITSPEDGDVMPYYHKPIPTEKPSGFFDFSKQGDFFYFTTPSTLRIMRTRNFSVAKNMKVGKELKGVVVLPKKVQKVK